MINGLEVFKNPAHENLSHHQHFTSAFFVQKRIFGAKISHRSCILGLKFLALKFCTKIAHRECWWNWQQVIVVANQSWAGKWQRESGHFEKCTVL